MSGKIAGLCISLAIASSAAAEPVVPERGSALRGELLDAARVMTGYHLGAPIEFVVNDMKADGDRALVNLSAQRPGGVPIDIGQSPMVLRDGHPPSLIDGPEMIAFLMRVDGDWYVDEFAIGATDVWWIGGPYCEHYASMLPAQACP